ncbi:MAG: zinc-ribbon domain-containing protein [FCB group bacterium]|nr:zinc-ribbon domain-containing protein [FCB group bacterium]
MTVVIVVFIILIAAVYFTLMPFMSEKVLARYQNANQDEYSADELKKINLLRQIKEVEFEREIGIIDQEDFHRVKSELMNETRDVMESIESEKTTAPKSAPEHCPKCSARVPKGSKFCGHCGTSLT